jgi:hypothetical protein
VACHENQKLNKRRSDENINQQTSARHSTNRVCFGHPNRSDYGKIHFRSCGSCYNLEQRSCWYSPLLYHKATCNGQEFNAPITASLGNYKVYYVDYNGWDCTGWSSDWLCGYVYEYICNGAYFEHEHLWQQNSDEVWGSACAFAQLGVKPAKHLAGRRNEPRNRLFTATTILVGHFQF